MSIGYKLMLQIGLETILMQVVNLGTNIAKKVRHCLDFGLKWQLGQIGRSFEVIYKEIIILTSQVKNKRTHISKTKLH